MKFRGSSEKVCEIGLPEALFSGVDRLPDGRARRLKMSVGALAACSALAVVVPVDAFSHGPQDKSEDRVHERHDSRKGLQEDQQGGSEQEPAHPGAPSTKGAFNQGRRLPRTPSTNTGRTEVQNPPAGRGESCPALFEALLSVPFDLIEAYQRAAVLIERSYAGPESAIETTEGPLLVLDAPSSYGPLLCDQLAVPFASAPPLGPHRPERLLGGTNLQPHGMGPLPVWAVFIALQPGGQVLRWKEALGIFRSGRPERLADSCASETDPSE